MLVEIKLCRTVGALEDCFSCTEIARAFKFLEPFGQRDLFDNDIGNGDHIAGTTMVALELIRPYLIGEHASAIGARKSRLIYCARRFIRRRYLKQIVVSGAVIVLRI